MKVMSFNIRCDVGTTLPGQADYWPRRELLVSEMIESQQPDVLGVQELMDSQIDSVMKGLGDGYSWVGELRDPEELSGERNAIFYSTKIFELLGTETVALSDTPDQKGSITWKNKNPRILTVACLLEKVTGAVITVINTHFDHISEYSRVKSALMVQRIVEGFGHIILMGDFNSVAEKSTAYALLTETLVDVSVTAKRLVNNWGTFGGYKEPILMGDRVDWILCTDDFDVDEYFTVGSIGGREYPSDHLPVVAVLNLKS